MTACAVGAPQTLSSIFSERLSSLGASLRESGEGWTAHPTLGREASKETGGRAGGRAQDDGAAAGGRTVAPVLCAHCTRHLGLTGQTEAMPCLLPSSVTALPNLRGPLVLVKPVPGVQNRGRENKQYGCPLHGHCPHHLFPDSRWLGMVGHMLERHENSRGRQPRTLSESWPHAAGRLQGGDSREGSRLIAVMC